MTTAAATPDERIFTILFNEEELTWQNIIYDLVKQEGMDPWDIDVSQISKKFLQRLRKLKDLDFRITGKMVFASALLLKMKSNRFMEEDMTYFDQLLAEPDEFDLLEDDMRAVYDDPDYPLTPRSPQPRKRKVSVFDLVKALEKALQVEARRKPKIKHKPVIMKIPERKVDLGNLMGTMFVKIEKHYKKNDHNLKFEDLVPGQGKMDKVLTFVPLLHLDSQQKVDIKQKQHFGEINIHLT